MDCSAQDLERVIARYSGGSEKRYVHQFNRKFIFTEGVLAVAQTAGAFWLLDLVALKLAPLYAKAWLAGETGLGAVKLEVYPRGRESGPAATVRLSLQDDAPDAYAEDLDLTDFPEGAWTFMLGTDQVDEDSYVSTMYLLSEH